ncbi:MAG: hypothetical protein KAS15_06165 [Nanoarchaeota archaeon]|nr:hypothetical protein [Nanoarchaeota archaeon]
MKGKIFGILAVFLIGLLSLTAVHAADYNTAAFDNVEFDGKDLDVGITRMRNYERGETLELVFDIIGEEVTNESIEDVRVEAFMRGDSHGDDVDDITNRFDIRSDRVYEKTLYLKIPDRMDRDTYTLTILITSKEGVLAETSYYVSIGSGSEDHKLVIKDVIFSPENRIEAGHAFLATVKVKNYGTRDEKDVKVRVAVPDLGISASAFLDEVEAEGEEDDVVIGEEQYLRIPRDALTGDYVVIVTAQYDDYDKTITEEYMIHVQGKETEEDEEAEEGKILISYIDAQELVAGEAGKIFPLTLVNYGDQARTAVLIIEGVEVFGEAKIEPSNVIILEAGTTKMIPIFVTADVDAVAGKHAFTINIKGLSEEEQTIIMTADVTVDEIVENAGWNNVKKGLEIALIVLVVLLVLLGLILGIGKLRSKDDEEDDSGDTYY